MTCLIDMFWKYVLFIYCQCLCQSKRLNCIFISMLAFLLYYELLCFIYLFPLLAVFTIFE